MQKLIIKGTQIFSGKEIPVVSGGFGQDKKCMSDKTIAEIHNITTSDVRKMIGRNLLRFKETMDYIDLKSSSSDDDLLNSLGYTKQQITQAEHIYLLSERGYAKLIKIMDSDLAWEIHDKLIDEYFHLRDNAAPKCIEDVLIESLQEMKFMRERLNTQDTKIETVSSKLDGIKEVVAMNSIDWREETGNLIRKMSVEQGGGQAFSQIRTESYEHLEKRMGVNLKTRLTFKRGRMADEGVCKSKRDKLSYLDIIGEDKKLIEGYVAIVKEMAIKYGLV